jgi:hypothetical protein
MCPEVKIVMRCFVIIVCLFFSSCTKQLLHRQEQDIAAPIDNSGQVDNNQNEKDYIDRIIQQEALLVDIPIPFFDERIIPSFFDAPESDTLVFGYKSPLSKDQAIDFFLKQMERLGWECLVSFESIGETLLQFKSPDRYCTVIIKNDSLSSLSIFIYIKRASTDACS